MSLRVWLPLNGDLHNQGMSNVEMFNKNAIIKNYSGKIGRYSYQIAAEDECIHSNYFQLQSNNQITICIWFKNEKQSSGGNYLGTIYSIFSDNGIVFGQYAGIGRIYTYISNSLILSDPNPSPYSNWHHLAITYNGQEVTSYVDGEKVNSTSSTQTLASTVYITIGAEYFQNTGEILNEGIGQYNDFRYYDHCLSPLEIKEIAQGLFIHYNPCESHIPANNYSCQDNSGYNNNAECHWSSGYAISPGISKTSLGPPSYIEFNGTSNYIKTNSSNNSPTSFEELTINLWINPGENQTNSYLVYGMGIAIYYNYYMNNKYYIWYSGFYTIDGQGQGEGCGLPISALTSGWNMVTFSDDFNYTKIYLNGEFYSQSPHTGQVSNISAYFHDRYLGTNATKNKYFSGKMGDFRVYASALSEDDIKALYNTSMRIDDSNNLHTSYLVEANNNFNRITPIKVLYSNEFNEMPLMLALKYDTRLWVEPDGSKWVHIYHHNAPQINGVFVNGDGTKCTDEQFENSLYLDENRWFDMRVCNYVDKWEIMTVRRASSSNDFVVNRWIQPANPMTASYDDVTNDSLTLITGGVTWMNNSGAYSQSYSYAGYYRNTLAGDQSYILASNKSTTWYGAIGAKQYWGSTEGTTSFNSTAESNAVKTGSVDIYLRFDNINTFSTVKIFDEHKIFAKEFIEY